MEEVRKIAKWFINNNEEIAFPGGKGNIKLNKLLYYAKGHYFDYSDEPLFKPQLEGWENGPVVSEIYRDYRYNELCSRDIGIEGLSSELIEFLNKINYLYGHKTTDELIYKTHNEKPWADVEEKVLNRSNPVISDEKLKQFFKNTKPILDAITDEEISHTEFIKINNNIFSYDKRETVLNATDHKKLFEYGEIVDNKSFFVYKENEELVVY